MLGAEKSTVMRGEVIVEFVEVKKNYLLGNYVELDCRSPPGGQVFLVFLIAIVLVKIGRTQFGKQAGSLRVNELVPRSRSCDKTKVKILEFVIFSERPQIRVKFFGPEEVIFRAS